MSDQRLDIRLARATWLANASASQRAAFDSYIDVELGLKTPTSVIERAASIRGKGFEADVSLPYSTGRRGTRCGGGRRIECKYS